MVKEYNLAMFDLLKSIEFNPVGANSYKHLGVLYYH